MQTIDIEKIMSEIRADIASKGLEDTDIQFENIILEGKSSDNSYEKSEFIEAIDKARPHAIVNASPELNGNIVSRVIKKIIRRIMAFHIEAIVDDQNDYNIYSHKAIAMLPDYIEETENHAAAMEAKLYECQKRIAALEKQLADKQD